MFQTIINAHKLFWLACNTISLKRKFVANYIIGVIQGIILFLSPLMLSCMIREINEKNINNILFYFYALVLLAIILVVGRFFWRRSIEPIGKIIPLNIKEIYYKRIFDLSYDWHLQNSVGYFSTALDKVSQLSRNWLWRKPYHYVANFVMAIFFLGYTFLVSIGLFFYFIISLLIMAFVIRIQYINRLKYIESYSRKTIAFERSFIDFLYNIRSVKKMKLYEFVNNILHIKNKASAKTGTIMMHYNATQFGFVEVYLNCLFLIPIGYFVYKFIYTGYGVEIIVMIASMQPKIAELGRQYMTMMGEIAQAKTECAILAEHLNDNIIDTSNEVMLKDWNQIVFKNTVFKFLKDKSEFSHQVHNLIINKGDKLAVMGKSGEGKSTFLNLLTRQFKISKGEILVDDINYNNLPESFFDNQITYISQDVELFDMSLYDNILMGKRIAKDKLYKVLKGCCLEELIERMNGNLHTSIGEKGVKVSGGERQRINLARGLLLDRQILVLDEITANLDPVTTKSIWEFIFANYSDKTIIAVSHEPELLKHINKKIEFIKGKGKIID